jgi:hypothetical protein
MEQASRRVVLVVSKTESELLERVPRSVVLGMMSGEEPRHAQSTAGRVTQSFPQVVSPHRGRVHIAVSSSDPRPCNERDASVVSWAEVCS